MIWRGLLSGGGHDALDLLATRTPAQSSSGVRERVNNRRDLHSMRGAA